jgi:hypothetical protein
MFARISSSPTEDGLALNCLFLVLVVLVSTDLLHVERDLDQSDQMIDPVAHSCYGTYVLFVFSSYRSAGNIDHHFRCSTIPPLWVHLAVWWLMIKSLT